MLKLLLRNPKEKVLNSLQKVFNPKVQLKLLKSQLKDLDLLKLLQKDRKEKVLISLINYLIDITRMAGKKKKMLKEPREAQLTRHG